MAEQAKDFLRDERSGRFKPGTSGGAGRPKGARSRFSEDFITDIAQAWAQHGPQVLQTVALTMPEKFLAACVQLMPRDVAVAVSADLRVEHAVSALEAYRLLKEAPPAEVRQIMKADAENN